jgi:hypothetical protein
MSAQTLVQLVAACIGILGSLFFAIGVMRQSVEAMGRLSGSYWDWNPHLPPALAAQKADYVFGGGLIVFAFTLQLMSFFASAEGSILNPRQVVAAPWVAIVFTAASFFALRAVAGRVASHYQQQIETWLKAKNEQKSSQA